MPKRFSALAAEVVIRYVLDLPPHRQREEDAEIDHEDGPVYRDVKRLRERAEQCNECGAGGGEPKARRTVSKTKYLNGWIKATNGVPKVPFR